ncbi:hypothetical protein GCM10023187_43720 [Nibrella viscosa]|uniref:TonB C-terminal domain-containing protein n=1 Tax=Nibrella viscosa TaxID=1084524 RepID=A0ABP8KSI7_9BACT
MPEARDYTACGTLQNGSVTNCEVVKGVTPVLDPEALRVVKTMSGKRKPGQFGGEEIRMKYHLPITFSLK